MASGTYASMLSWSSQATNVLSQITDTLDAVQQASVGVANATQRRQIQFDLINSSLNGDALTTLLQYDELYLYPVTGYATSQYIKVASDSLTSVNTSKTFVLIFWLVFTVFFYLFFFSPLVFKLHAEHRRTTGMVRIDCLSCAPLLVVYS